MQTRRLRVRPSPLAWAALLLAAPLHAAPAQGEATTRVSVGSAGAEATGSSSAPSLSADGRIVAFASRATNLVAGDGNGASDIFVVDRTQGAIVRVSVDSSGLEGNGDSFAPALSADGAVVAFQSFATNLVSGDTNGHADIFVHVLATGTTERVSVTCKCVQGDGDASSPALSANGQLVAFATDNTLLIGGDTNGVRDVFVHDRATGLSRRVSLDSAGVQGNGASDHPSLSADGRLVAFVSEASNLVAGDGNGLADLFLHDRTAATTARLTVDLSGGDPDGASEAPSLSGDGRLVAFASHASDLVAGDGNGVRDLFVRDVALATTTRISVASGGGDADQESFAPSLASDGGFVAFASRATNLVAGDSNGATDLFVQELATGSIERASVAGDGSEGNGPSGDGASAHAVAIGARGFALAFASAASNLVAGDANGVDDLFVRDRCVLASAAHYGSGFPGTLGVPSLVAATLPRLGLPLAIDVGSSATTTTAAVLLLGDTAAAIPLRKGGELLLVPQVALSLSLPSGGLTLTEDLPDDPALCGLELFAQTLLVDPGAARGQSASAGLALVLGV